MTSIVSRAQFFGHLLFIGFFIFSCQSSQKLEEGYYRAKFGNNKKIKVKVVTTIEDQTRGLSGIKPENFPDDHAMLFAYPKDGLRNFWMPDTYMDLDLFYLDKNFKVVDIVRDLPHHPGRNEPPAIARAKPVFCRHVLEMKSSSKLAKNIRLGETLTWSPNQHLPEILQGTHSPK